MKLWRIENGRLTLALHEAQARCWRSTRRFVFFIAGTQSGKTSFGPWWLWNETNRCGAGDYIAATSSYDLFKLKMLPEIRDVFEHQLGIGRYWAGDKVLELRDPQTGQFRARVADDPMYARIILRSAQSKGGLESATAKAAWLDEVGQDEFDLEAWEAVQRRLSLSRGRVLGTTTPYNLGWLKTEVYDRWRAGDTDFDVVQASSTINPAFPPEEYSSVKAKMATWKFAMFYDGLLTRPAGLIYGDYSEAVHMVAPFEIPAEWPRYVGYDFGGVNLATVWLAEDVARRALYLYRETLDGGKTTGEHARAALGHAKTERVVLWMGGAGSEDQQRRDFTAEGVPIQEPPIADVEAGIDRVIALLKQKRLFVFETCKGTRDELGSYRRKTDAQGQPTDEIQDKRKYHRLDALRYIVSGLDEIGPLFWE